MRSGLSGVAAYAGKTTRIGMPPRDCREVTIFSGETEGAIQPANRLVHFAERPQDHSQPAHGNDPVIEDKPGGRMMILLVS